MKLSDEKIVAALLSCSTNKQAADKLGISEVTLYNRMKADSFKKKLQEAKDRIFEKTTSTMTVAFQDSTSFLLSVVHDKNAPLYSRINAAAILQKQGLRVRELEAVEKEIAELRKNLL